LQACHLQNRPRSFILPFFKKLSSAGYSSFGLGASYNSLLSNGYASSAYSPYGSQAGYGCLNYANAFPTGDASGFGISSALAGAASGRYAA
jgi:hypothetical protein